METRREPTAPRGRRWVTAALIVAATCWPISSAAASHQAREAVLRGTYVVVTGDAASRPDRPFLKANGRLYRLSPAPTSAIRPGQPVEVSGTLSEDGRAIAVDGIRAVGAAPPRDRVDGPRRVLVAIVQWPGEPAKDTPSAVAGLMFGTSGSLASWYATASTARVSFSGDVTPVLDIPDPSPIDPDDCATDDLYDGAYSAAVDAGYDPDSYDHFMIDAANMGSSCNWGGYGEIDGSITWIYTRFQAGYLDVPLHEIGHNLGLMHSHGLECWTDPLSEACLAIDDTSQAWVEYGNVFDVMGCCSTGDFGAVQQNVLGWLNGDADTIDPSGSFQLSPVEATNPASPQALVLDTSDGAEYWFELRRPIGVDANLGNQVGVLVNVLLPGGDPDYPEPFLVDMTPSASSANFYDASLQAGSVFADPSGDFSAYVTSVTASSAGLVFGGPGALVFQLTPESGPVGTSVAITGSHLTGATDVGFNGAHASPNVVSDTLIDVTVPAGATTGPVEVTTPDGTAESSSDFVVTVLPPTVKSFRPSSGSAGVQVKITGANLGGASSVTFNGAAATFHADSPTQITATLPMAATTGPVAVVAPGGTATTSKVFKVKPAPAAKLSSFKPARGPIGTTVTLKGSGFTGTSAVSFHGTAAQSFTVVSAKQIVATVAPGTSTGTITVQTPAGPATSKKPFTVT